MQRVAVFIDNYNLQRAVMRVGIDLTVDFLKLRSFLEEKTKGKLQLTLYVPGLPRNNTEESKERFKKWLLWLGKNNIFTFTKEPSQRSGFNNDSDGDDDRAGLKCNFDVEIAVDATRAAISGLINQIILISGDGDFCYLVKELRKAGVFTSVMASEENISSELRIVCDEFISLELLGNKILKKRDRK